MRIVIDDELRPAVIEFVTEMLNDPCCESILLDVGENARVDSDLAVLYLDITGKHCDYTLSIVGDEYSGGIRYATGKTRMIVEGETGTWGLRGLFDEIKTKLWEDK